MASNEHATACRRRTDDNSDLDPDSFIAALQAKFNAKFHAIF